MLKLSALIQNRWWLLWVVIGTPLLLCWAIQSSVLAATNYDVVVVADLSSTVHGEFIDTLRQDAPPQVTLNIVDIAEFQAASTRYVSDETRLLLCVGVSALEAVVNVNLSTPVWATLLPQRSFETLVEQTQERDRYSAWFIDQPLSRRFDLLQFALPTAERVGVLVGELSNDDVRALENAALERSLKLVVRKVRDGQDAVAKNRDLAESVEVVLAVPDRIALNLNNAKGILLGAYRQRVPIVGYTRAYVRAGALVAVYSMPAQIAQHVAEELSTLTANESIKTVQHHPKYFSVEINSQVARSLGIQLPSEEFLLSQLQQNE